MLVIYDTTREARSAAVETARSAAADNGEVREELVLLPCGDTLHVRSTPGGRIRLRTSAGWSTVGLRHASRNVASVAR